jgi:Domain of unknown function (DUF4365)
MPLPQEHLLDELATAYVQTVAAVAGATIAVSRRDYGVDGTLKHIARVAGNRFVEFGFPVDFQLKGTTAAAIGGGQVTFDLKVRNYDLIVERHVSATPYYLFLVCFGGNTDRWIVQTAEELILSASAYWWTETGGRSSNSSSVRISIPVAQRLSVPSMESILEAAKQRFVR